MKVVIKSFIQFLSIILCTFLLLLITSFETERVVKEYNAGILNTSLGESVTFDEVYTVPVGTEKIYDAVITGIGDAPTQTIDSSEKTLIGQFLAKENSSAADDELIFTFTGDCTLGVLNNTSLNKGFHAYVSASDSPTYPFDETKEFFENDDLTVINFEGTLTEKRNRTDKEYRFAGEPEWAKDMIAASGIEVCNVANNHSYDYYKDGYDDTVNAITNAGMAALDETMPYITEIDGVEVVILSGNYVHDAAKPQRAGLALTNYLIEQIKQYKRSDNIVIVSCHWGVELQTSPIPEQKTRAHSFIDAGADFVVGNHPHVIQGIEMYKDKYICYSLGNFAFGGNPSVKSNVLTTMFVRPRFAVRNGITIATGLTVIPCYTTSHTDLTVNNYKPQPIFGEKAEKAEEKILKLSKSLTYGVEEIECPSIEITE